MMDWLELKNNFTMTTVTRGVAIDGAMENVCQHIVTTVIPKNLGVEWDYLRIELWPDSGRLIFFPASTSNAERIEKAGCQVVFEDLLAKYNALADSDLDDDAFVAALLREERLWIEQFLHFARSTNLSGRRCQFWEGDGELPICVVQV
ncbi:MAG: hypothetical protein WKF77_28515 [Planctomycetaceae bacterium]